MRADLLRRSLMVTMLALLPFSPGLAQAVTAGPAAQALPVLQVIAGDNNPPFNFVPDGRPAGMSIELVEEMARRAGLQVNLQHLPWSRAVAIARITPNSILLTAARIPEREAWFDWIGPVAEREIWLYRRADRPDIVVNSIEDAKKYLIATTNSNASTTYLKGLGFRPGVNLDVSGTGIDIERKMRANRVDLIPIDPDTVRASELLEGPPQTRIEPAFLLTREGGMYFGLNKDSAPELLAKLNAAFAAMQKDGSFQRISKKWRHPPDKKK